jgi:cell division protein FtsW
MLAAVETRRSLAKQASERAHPPELDWLVLAVGVLLCLGLVMAVSVRGPSIGPLLALKGHGSKVAVGLLAFVVAALVPLDRLQRRALPLLAFGIGLCLIAALFGPTIKGARRWLPFGGQPVELARLALVVFAAAVAGRAPERVATLRGGFVPIVGAGAALAGALAVQPDMGNAMLVLALAAAIALVAGVHVRWFALFTAPALALLVLLGLRHDYVQHRVLSFLADEPSYQVRQSLLAIAAGGFDGAGLGAGRMKLGFLPEAGNDFLFAVVAEELGLLGAATVLALFGVIALCTLRLMARAPTRFLRYLIFGCGFAICLQAVVNLLVVTGRAPPKGIDLPFLSSGGTNLVFYLAAVGIIGNAARASWHAPQSHGRV